MHNGWMIGRLLRGELQANNPATTSKPHHANTDTVNAYDRGHCLLQTERTEHTDRQTDRQTDSEVLSDDVLSP